jgi:ABC-type nitrate/sulfonate/bicarbonate transport system substrate-binding protein
LARAVVKSEPASRQGRTPSPPPLAGSAKLRLGFVPLTDAAPLIAAQRCGYFADEGVVVTLERQIGWGNVRDKLVYGHLHASHALVGMPPISALGRDRFFEPLAAVCGLGAGGNAITFSSQLISAGVHSLDALAKRLRLLKGASAPTLAHVFGCSMHHYLLRDALDTAGINPDRDVRLCVLPPPQMLGQLRGGHLDGFCVGQPWNSLAERDGDGRIVLATTQVLPSHPEKVLVVSRRWLSDHAREAQAIVRAILRGCAYCNDPANDQALAEALARPEYLDVPAAFLLETLKTDRAFSLPGETASLVLRSASLAHTFPSATHVGWLLREMVRWGHLPPDTDVASIAGRSVDTAAYRRAAESLSIACPADDFPPMPLRRGTFELRETTDNLRAAS